MGREINGFSRSKRQNDSLEIFQPYSLSFPQILKKYDKGLGLTKNQERKQFKKELKFKLENGEITNEEYQEQLLNHKKRISEINSIPERISENKISENRDIFSNKIITIFAVEDGEIFQNNLYLLEKKLNELGIECELIVEENLNMFKTSVSDILFMNFYNKNTFYVLDNYFPDEEGGRIIQNNGKNAYDFIEKKDKKLDKSNIAVVSSDTSGLSEIYPENVNIIGGKSSYSTSYINVLKEWIIDRLK